MKKTNVVLLVTVLALTMIGAVTALAAPRVETFSSGNVDILRALGSDISATKIKKLEMLDQITGDTYCTWIENGELKKEKGECGSGLANLGQLFEQPTVPPVDTAAEAKKIQDAVVTAKTAAKEAQAAAKSAQSSAKQAQNSAEQTSDNGSSDVAPVEEVVVPEEPAPVEEVVPVEEIVPAEEEIAPVEEIIPEEPVAEEVAPVVESILDTAEVIQAAGASLLDGSWKLTKWLSSFLIMEKATASVMQSMDILKEGLLSPIRYLFAR